MRELWRGNVNAWECDELGHMNVRFYAEKVGEALSYLAADLSLTNAEMKSQTSRLRTTELHCRWLREARAGAPLAAAGGVISFGSQSMEAAVLMRHRDGAPCAGFIKRYDHVSTSTGLPFSWAERMREAAQAAMIAPPEEACPRSIAQTPHSGDASLACADELDLLEIGRGVFRPDETDADGEVRSSVFIGRTSDGAMSLFGDLFKDRDASDIASAAVEGRLLIIQPPRAGQRFVIRSAIHSYDEHFSRFVHWFLEPDSGICWATYEVVALSFDLKTRKKVAMSETAHKAMADYHRPDITP